MNERSLKGEDNPPQKHFTNKKHPKHPQYKQKLPYHLTVVVLIMVILYGWV